MYEVTSKKEYNFTNQKKKDIINEDKISQKNANLSPLNDMQKSNIASAKKAMESGVISKKQYENNLKLNGINTTEKQTISAPKLPNEKLEIERLKKITGEYNLSKISPNKLDDSIRLKKKTTDDYYKRNSNISEEQKRLDEVLGPKTDFSIANFENNYDKMNREEQEILVHKMQLEFNRQGYRDKDGFSLKTDGIYGNKTKSVYEKYIRDNAADYNEALESKYNILKDKKGNPLLLASNENNISDLIPQNSILRDNKNLNKEGNNEILAKNDSSDKKNKMNLSNVPKDRDKEVLKNEDYEKIQIYKAIYNFAKYELKDDAIADSMHREAVAIRQQDKYSMYEDYGPKRIKKFDKNKGTQYVGIEGYADNDYEYSNAKDTVSIVISNPLSASAAEWEGARILGHISNANAMTGELEFLNVPFGVVDFIISKTYPLYNLVREGDIIVTVIKHRGENKQTKIKEYRFYFGKDKSIFYYVK